MPRYFHIVQIMKTIARVPLARLEASPQHVEAFKALAHVTRLQVFFFLVRARGEVSVGEIQEAVEVPGPTLSHHLDLLRRAGLIESRKEERYVYYSVRQDTVTALVCLLTACC
jgi:ArsR family transcriptional regulator